MKIGYKIVLEFIPLILLTAVVGIFAVRAILMITQDFKIESHVSSMALKVSEKGGLISAIILVDSLVDFDQLEQQLIRLTVEIDAIQSKLEQNSSLNNNPDFQKFIQAKNDNEKNEKQILSIHKELLTRQSTFGQSYLVEDSIRTRIQTSVFETNDLEIIKSFVLAENARKFALQDHLEAISNLKRLVDQRLGKNSLLANKLSVYQNSAEIMTEITLREQEVNNQGAVILATIRQQEVTLTLLRNLIVDKVTANTTRVTNNSAVILIIIFTLALFISAVSGFVISRSISRPVELLMKGISSFASGNLSKRIEIKTKDEFGQLAGAFNQMADSLALYSVDLEKKVVERTREVEAKTRELDRAKVHIETVVENLTSGLVEYDSNFTILRINHAAEEMLGVQRGSVVGKQIKPEDTAKIELESLARVSYPGLTPGGRKIPKDISGVFNAEVHEITIKHPLERELQVVTAPVVNPATGEMYGFVKVIRDITREKMIAKSKSEFISIAAHQLRTPLSGVKWTMKLIMDGDMGPLNPEQLQYLEHGYETAQKMVVLVNDLLNVARIEDGRFGYEFKVADIMETLSAVINNSKLAAKAKNIEVEFIDNTGGVAPFVFDDGKISLAVQNLLDNAIKYTNPMGKVVFEIEKEGDYLKAKISDNGVGVPKAQVGRLFSKFFRADNVIQMQTDGSGLGLFIVKNIILRHGGNITMESEEGKGTTIIFIIPLKEELIPKEERLTYY